MTAGDEFRITWEWEPAPGVHAAEHQATWARIEIQVGPDWVTLVEDRESRSSRRSIYCSLYPLAEWVAYNWWSLQADSRPANFLSQDPRHVNPASRQLPAAARDHHSIRASGDGFAWPDLLIVPDGRHTRFVWEADHPGPPNAPIRFLTRGDTWIKSDVVQRELASLVTSVLTRLAERGVGGTVPHKEWDALQHTTADEAEFCLAAARLGLDPYCGAEDYEQQIMRAWEVLPVPLLGDFLDAVEPARIDDALAWISSAQRAIERASAKGVTNRRGRILQELQGAVASVSKPAGAWRPEWDLGYDQARAVRAEVGLDNTAPFDVESYVSRVTRAGADVNLQAIGAPMVDQNPLVVIGRDRPQTSLRFTLSRALWHSLWNESPIFAVTSAHTSRQRVERAFAAELLAPAQGIAALLESPPPTAAQDDVERVARRFGVSSMVIDHQIRNRLVPAV